MSDHLSAQELFDELCAPFETSQIEWRVGSTTQDKAKGMALAYINARTVMDRLDAVCGPDGWQAEHYPAGGERLACKIGVRLEGEWVWKSDGAGETDVEGEKGAFSSALKRAAVSWGIGRYLYDMESPWVELDNKRIPPKEMKKLDEAHERAATSANWGERGQRQAFRLLCKVAKEFVTDQGAAQEFKDKNAPEIALLPVAMRRHLFDVLDRVGAARIAEAAE
jgi:hypothetical protein